MMRRDRTLVDLGKDNYTREFCMRIASNGRVEEEDAFDPASVEAFIRVGVGVAGEAYALNHLRPLWWRHLCGFLG